MLEEGRQLAEGRQSTVDGRQDREARRLGGGQAGQAMVLAAIGLLIMALGVIATLNLGQAVHQKIKLQNTADSAAYSLATIEARAFNYTAFLNRTQIVHYNTAMVLQSYLTHLGFLMAMVGTVRDLLYDSLLSSQNGCPRLCLAIPICRAYNPYCYARQVLEPWVPGYGQGVHAVLTGVGYLDALFRDAVQAMSVFNNLAVWQMQTVRLLQVNTFLLTGMHGFISSGMDTAHGHVEGLDPELDFSQNAFNSVLNAVFNSLEFRQVFDRGAGFNPFLFDGAVGLMQGDLARYSQGSSDPAVRDAQGVMAEIVNASRFSRDVYNRSGRTLGTLGFVNLGNALSDSAKMGQTRMIAGDTSQADGRPTPRVGLIRPGAGSANYQDTPAIAADDFLTSSSLGFAFAGIAVVLSSQAIRAVGDGVVADGRGGMHYGYLNAGGGNLSGRVPVAAGGSLLPGFGGNWGGAFPSITNLLGTRAPTATFGTVDQGNHRWAGLAPYYQFKPNPERSADFGQPSTWIFLNKHHRAFQDKPGGARMPWHYRFGWNWGDKQSHLDTTIAGPQNSFLLEGLTVISRGMVYYHRPDNWEEQPNFFNPFWRAKLAPVGQALTSLFDRYLLSGMNVDGQESAILRAMLNLARGFLGDVFLRVVTSVITH
jgi:hypothetical protein